jgi:proton-translocating NADH-quinone oxidoreductase chain N
MFNPFLYLLFTFVSINWFLIFTPIFQFASFNWFLIWSSILSGILLFNHPFVDTFEFGEIIYASSYPLLVLFIFTLFFIPYLTTLFNSSVSYYKELPLLLLIIYFGFSTLIVSNDLLILYLSIELYSLTFYLITTIHQNYYTTEAGIKYFIYNFLAGAFYLLGCVLIYYDFGTINFIHLSTIPTPFSMDGLTPGNLGYILVIISFLFKLSIAPFHFWTPDVYQGALYPITAFFTIFPKFIVGAFLLKFYITVPSTPSLNTLLLFCGLLSVFIGSIGAFTQYNIKRLFAYSTIANAGFLIILIGLGTPLSSQIFYFYILTYLIGNLGLFTLLIHGNISNLQGLKNLRIGGLAPNILYAALLSLPVFSLAGLPPFVGFTAKYLTIFTIFNEGSTFISILLLIFSILSLFYYLRFIHYLYFYGKENEGKEHERGEIDIYQGYVAVIANISLIFFAINPSLLFLIGGVLSSGI